MKPAIPLAAIGLAIAALCSACGGGSHQATPTTTTTTIAPSSTRSGQLAAVAACLSTHGVPASHMAAALGKTSSTATTTPTPGVSSQTLEAAGNACQSALTAKETAHLQELDNCLAAHGITIAKTSSPLANILLLNPDAANVHAAISTCAAAQRLNR